MRQFPLGAFGSRVASILLGGLAAAGCYKYAPVQLASVNPKEDVRVRVTESAAARMVSSLGVYTTELDGLVASEANDSVSIAVPISRVYRGMTVESGRQVMFLGRGEVVDVQRRELARGRSVIFGVGAVAVGVLLVNSVVQIFDPNPSSDDTLPPPPPPEPNLRFFLGSIRIPFR